jgi:hypothetical protein
MPSSPSLPTAAALAVLAVLLSAPAPAQLPPHLVAYRQLTWADFQGTTAPLGPEVAKIMSGVHVDPFDVEVEHLGGNSWIARAKEPRVYSYMDPSLSGVRPAGNSDYTLAHEQLHFDISELYARRMLTALREVEVKGEDPVRVRFDLEERLFRVRAELLSELGDMQDRYDRDCGHGKKKRSQKNWQKKIAKQLRKAEV